MNKRLAAAAALVLLAACSGGGGGGGAAGSTPPLGSAPPRTASDKTIPVSAYMAVALPCQEIDGLAVADDGSAWFSQNFPCNTGENNGNDVIGRVTPSGTLTIYHTPTANSYPFGLVKGSDSMLYASEEEVGKLVRIDPSTGAMTEFAIPSYQGQAPSVRWLGSGPDGNIWFANFTSGAYALGTFNVTTHQFAFYPAGMDLSNASHVIAGPQGNIWLSNASSLHNGSVPFGVYNTSGSSLAQYQAPYALGELILASDGNVWFTQDNYPGYPSPDTLSLGRMTPSGTVTTFTLPASVANGPALTGLAQAGDGYIYAGLFNNNAIVQSNLDGAMTVYSFPPSCNGVQPFLLAAGQNNALWLADDGDTKHIYRIDLTQLH